MSDQIQALDFSSQAGAGLDNVSNEDIQIPYLQIIQTTEFTKNTEFIKTNRLDGFL